MDTKELEMRCRELRELQGLISEAQEEAEAIKDAIKALMGDSEAVRAGAYQVTWKTVKAVKLDVSALKAALPEVAARFSRETVTRRFCVA